MGLLRPGSLSTLARGHRSAARIGRSGSQADAPPLAVAPQERSPSTLAVVGEEDGAAYADDVAGLLLAEALDLGGDGLVERLLFHCRCIHSSPRDHGPLYPFGASVTETLHAALNRLNGVLTDFALAER